MAGTIVLAVDPLNPDIKSIRRAAEVIKEGGLVAFPTETVYGLGANALDAEAVRKIFVAKGRPLDNPIIVHIASVDQLDILTDRPEAATLRLAERFWPGPLTIVLRKSSRVPEVVTAGGDTVAIRMPDHRVAASLIRESGVPVAAPSANVSERPSGTTGVHVLEDLGGKIDLVLDAGMVRIGVESTVLDLSVEPPAILRPGAVGLEDLEAVLGKIDMGSRGEGLARSPGVRHRHYSPRASLILVEASQDAVVLELARQRMKSGDKVAILTQIPSSYESRTQANIVAMPAGLDDYARQMFAVLREMDAKAVDVIIVEGVEERGIGRAIMDRLKRASSSGK